MKYKALNRNLIESVPLYCLISDLVELFQFGTPLSPIRAFREHYYCNTIY